MHYEVGLSRSLCLPVNDIVVGLLFSMGINITTTFVTRNNAEM